MSSTCVHRAPVWSPLIDPSQTELAMNTHTIVVDMRRDMLKSREDTEGQNLAVNSIHAFCVTGQYLPSLRSRPHLAF